MKITLDGLDGRNFTLRLPRDAGGEHVVTLLDTRALRGLYEHDAARFSLDPVEADAITGEVAWVLAEGTLHLGGPAAFGATRVDVDIRRDDATPGVTGEARCASLDAPVTRLHRGGMELYGALSFAALAARRDEAAGGWVVSMDALGARGASLARGGLQVRLERLDARAFRASFGDATEVAASSLTVEGLDLTSDGLTVRAAGATLTGVKLTRAGDALTVEAAGAALTGAELTRGQVTVRAPSLRLNGLRYGPEGIAAGAVTAESIAVAVHGLGAGGEPSPSGPAPEAQAGRRALGVDLPLLDGVAGRVEADVVVDVKLPVIERREGTHRLRLELRDGTIDFKQLERGLSALEDAVIDFEVDDAGLYLEVDAVVVKRELARWPLDAEGLRLARQSRVRLRTFARPTVASASPAPRAESEGPPSVALRRVEVRRLLADLAVKGSSTLPAAGGTLRLGGADGGGDALRALRVSGELVHDATAPSPETAVAVALEGLDVGVDGVALGGRRLDVARAQVGEVAEGRVTFRGFTPTAVALDLRAVALTGLKLGAPAAT